MREERFSNEVGLRPATDADFEFAYRVKKAALEPYITQIWGWDETFQREYHLKDFVPSRSQIVTFNAEDVGWMAVDRAAEKIHIIDIFISPEFQGKGIGSQLIRDLLREAKEKRVPVRLGVFKVNPAARRLYERLGFSVTGETETHYDMEALA